MKMKSIVLSFVIFQPGKKASVYPGSTVVKRIKIHKDSKA